jgi:hypothetical protein
MSTDTQALHDMTAPFNVAADARRQLEALAQERGDCYLKYYYLSEGLKKPGLYKGTMFCALGCQETLPAPCDGECPPALRRGMQRKYTCEFVRCPCRQPPTGARLHDFWAWLRGVEAAVEAYYRGRLVGDGAGDEGLEDEEDLSEDLDEELSEELDEELSEDLDEELLGAQEEKEHLPWT